MPHRALQQHSYHKPSKSVEKSLFSPVKLLFFWKKLTLISLKISKIKVGIQVHTVKYND